MRRKGGTGRPGARAAAAAAAVLAALLAAVGLPSRGAAARAPFAPAPSGATVAPKGSSSSAVATTPYRLAYVTSSEAHPFPIVWSSRADGSEPEQLGPGDGPLLSPDGSMVAAGLFGAEGDTENGPSLAIYSTAGAAALKLGSLARASALPLAWSPDSRYLAVYLQSTAVRNVARHSGLAILDTRTGSLRTVASGIVYGASFAADGSDRVVFARAGSQLLSAAVNLYTVSPGGAGLRRITSDGRSLFPIWDPARPGYIAYDSERLRAGDAPVYQIWLRSLHGGRPRRLTSVRVRSLVSGLMPLAFSRSGSRLLAEFVGQDTSEAWTVRVPSGRARAVRVNGRQAVGGGISSDGSRLLVDEGVIEGPATGDDVLSVPFGGGAPTLLVAHAAQASWNE